MIRKYKTSDLAQLLSIWERSAKIAHSFLDPAFFEKKHLHPETGQTLLRLRYQR